VVCSTTVPATTTVVVATVYSSTAGSIGDQHQIDSLLIEYSSTVGDYFDGSTNPAASWTGTANNSTSTFVGRANLCTNPSLETNSTGWTSAQPSTVRSGLQELYGEFSLQVPMSSLTDSNVGTFTFTAAAPGTYAISMYVYTPPLSSLAGRTVSVTREAGTATSTQTSQISPTLVGGQWVRISEIRNVTVVGTITMVFRLSGTLSTAVGQTLYFDGALVEQSATVDDYFDGNTSPLCSWTGTANNSTSVEQTTTMSSDPYRNVRPV